VTTGTTQGDNGAPLFREVNGLYYQVGVFSWSENLDVLPGLPSVYAQIPLNVNGFDWIRQTVCGDWEIEASFCIECYHDCDCPDNYECLCYEEIEFLRRLNRRAEIENKLKFLNEGFLSPDHGKDDAVYEFISQQHPGSEVDSSQRGTTNNGAGRTRKLSKSSGDDDDDDDGKGKGKGKGKGNGNGKGKGSNSCNGSSEISCDAGEAGYCFRIDTFVVVDFDGGKKSGYD
jgi:hypothetical protein